MDEKEIRVKEIFRLRGAELGDLFGRIVTMQEGESVSFNGIVFVRDDNERIDSYNGNLNLGLIKDAMGYRNYALFRDNFNINVAEVGHWIMSDRTHPINVNRTDLGPYLVARREREPGVVVIESKLELSSDSSQ